MSPGVGGTRQLHLDFEDYFEDEELKFRELRGDAWMTWTSKELVMLDPQL